MLNNIESERVRNGLSKAELSEKLGVSTKTYYNWINEKTDIPSSLLLKMSCIFNVDMEYLLCGSRQ
jgi:transcriptional regulator with XRE-family HTH domain